MPITPKPRFAPFSRVRRTLDGMYAHIDDTIADLPATPVAQQAVTTQPITMPTAPTTPPVVGISAA